MIFHYTLLEKEYLAIDAFVQGRLLRNSRLLQRAGFLNTVLWVSLAIAFGFTIKLTGGETSRTELAIQVLILFVIVGSIVLKFLQAAAYRALIVDGSHLLNQQWTAIVTDEGITFNATRTSMAIRWQGVDSVVQADGAVCVFFGQVVYMPIAASAFISQAAREEFLQFAVARIAATRNAPQIANEIIPVAFTPIEAQDLTAQIPAQSSALVLSQIETTPRWQNAQHMLTQNIVNALKLALFIRVPLIEMPVMWWQCLIFPLFSVLILFMLSFMKVGFGGEFQLWSLPNVVYPITVYLVASIVTAYAARQPEKSLAAFQILLMIAFAIDVVILILALSALGNESTRNTSIFMRHIPISLSTIWLGAAGMVAMARLFKLTVVPVLLTIALIVAPLSLSFGIADLWVETQAMQEANYKAYFQNQITEEDNFYKQPTLLADALAALTPERPGVPELFFIGFAGDGHQNVFRKEVDAVATLMQERFDTNGHSIKLINNVGTAGSEPIASLTSLQAALKKTAATMDVEEDVLVLFLTSHGSENHQFSLSLSQMQFKVLDPIALRKALDASGIKNRVVIISACYSGGFVEALKNENTLVIAAAAPDRKSFGCSNENDWTYFGKAYFDEALRLTTSFTKAFSMAVPVIAARESGEGYTQSQPMMNEGEAIRAKLAAIEQRLEKKEVAKE